MEPHSTLEHVRHDKSADGLEYNNLKYASDDKDLSFPQVQISTG